MTGHYCSPCLLFLTILLLIYNTLGKPADNNHIYSHMNPLVGSASMHQNTHHTKLEKNDHLFMNVDNQKDSLSSRLQVLNITDILVTKLKVLNAKIGVNHRESWRTEQMAANSRLLRCLLFPIKCIHTDRYSTTGTSNNMSVDNTAYEHFKSLYYPYKHVNGFMKSIANSPPVPSAERSDFRVVALGNNDEDTSRNHRTISDINPPVSIAELTDSRVGNNDEHTSRNHRTISDINLQDNIPPVSIAEPTDSRVGNNDEHTSRNHRTISNMNDIPKHEVRTAQRTRFARDTGREDFVEGNRIWDNLPVLLAPKPEVEFGISQLNNVFDRVLEDLAETENAQFRIPKADDFVDPIDAEFQTVPVTFNSPLEDEEISDRNLIFSESDLDDDISNRNVYQILHTLPPYSDDDIGDPMDESMGFTKRDNRYFSQIQALLKQSPDDSLKAPLQDRPRRHREKHERSPENERPLELFVPHGRVESCHLESDGTKPLRCPSDTSRCLYDTQICDGTANCPRGEDETFTLCVLRHWTFKFMRKFLPLS